MPTPRRKSTPAQPSSPLTPLATTTSSLNRSTSTSSAARNRPTTPTPTTPLPAHHHKSADELALLEAERILQTTPLSVHHHHDLRNGGSERDRRHWKLQEAREALEKDREGARSRKGDDSEGSRSVTGDMEGEEGGREISLGPEEDDKGIESVGTGLVKPATESHLQVESEVGGLESGEGTIEGFGIDDLELPKEMMDDQAEITATSSLLDENVLGNDGTIAPGVTGGEDIEGTEAIENRIVPTNKPHAQDERVDGESSDSSDNSDSSDTSDTSDEDDEDSNEDEDEEDEAMERLLEAAKRAAIAKDGDKGTEKEVQVQENDDEVVLQFDQSEGKRTKQAPIPDLSIPTLPKPHLTFDSHGAAHASTTLPQLTSQAGPSKTNATGQRQIIDESQLERDDRPYEKQMSKREKKAQPKKATPSELWASIPSARADRLPQMKRDYQALALAASLDPKRFMKGGKSATTKVPELFAIGTMVDPPRHLQDTTIQREAKYRPGQVVENLARNEDVGGYAKRKYGDLQGARMDNGRGKGWKKRTKW